MEDDLYGGDLYGDAGGEYEGGYGDDVQAEGLQGAELLGGQKAGSGSRDLFDDLPSIRQDDAKDFKLTSMGSGQQQQQQQGQQSADRWRSAFREVAAVLGLAVGGRDPDTHTVLESVRRLKASDTSAQEELRKLRRRDAALQMQLADRNLEALELRRELAAAAAAAEPSVVQLKQLMLDPAVAREFARLRAELEAAQAELATAREELTAVTFTQESKVGRQLMAKCRSLQEENEEMGRELAEGKAQAAEAAAALARAHADDMRAAFKELEDHCQAMEDEAEELQREVFALRARVTDLERDAGLPPSLPPGPGGMGGGMGPGGMGLPMGPGGFGGRGRFDMGGGGFRGRGRGPPGMGGFKRPFGDRDGMGGPMGGRGGFIKRIR
ncbi:hypothetical protein HYH02_009594 [Chlamydomonas schloesseri]|uniref:Uncharacterized protein n=1 Tax=Chlamydomonas schloesseri TaxID=2026947 RepID=A0A835W7A8_9CHLO|nr:hypothetical protein HYH02_009594 [Chlamydomonas schloesseri]|eukprot:KAG2442105.1 hypothetical protein HYH02_009594 [Chlamydomonas schloesseri]